MRLFDLVEQNDGIRAAADFFCQLSSLVIANISRRRTDHPCNRVLFHKLGHVQTNQRLVGVEQFFCQHLYQFRLTYASGTDKDKRCRTAAGTQLHSGALDCLRQQVNCLILSDDVGFQPIFQIRQLCEFRLSDFVCRDSRPQFDHLRQIITCHLHIVQFLGSLFNAGIQANPLALYLCQFLIIDLCFVFQCLFFLLQLFLFLHQRIIRLDFRRAQIGAGTAFVQQVDCLIRQETVCDIAFRQNSAETNHFRRNVYPMIGLVVLCNAVQHLNGLVNGRLVDSNRLETAFQRRILFDILAVFFKCCCTDHLDLATGKRRFQNVRRIHRAFGISCADQIVNLVNKQDDVSLLLYLCDQTLDTAFELPTELCSGNQRGQIQQVYLLVFQVHRNISGMNPQSDSLGDGGFADTRFTDQTRIVFGAAGQNLNHTCDFLVPSDHCIQFSVGSTLAQIGAVVPQEFQLLFPLGAALPAGRIRNFGIVCLGYILVTLCRHSPVLQAFQCLSGILNHVLQKLRHHTGTSHFKTVTIHHVHHLIRDLFQFLVRDSHLFHIFINLRHVHFLCTYQTQTIVFLFIPLHCRNKDNRRTLFASAA